MNLQDYFNRILPLVGTVFREKTVAIINPAFSCLIADALARCGLKKQLYFLSSKVLEDDALAQSYGQKYIGKDSGQALCEQFKTHNSLETDWDLQVRKEVVFKDVVRILREHQVDLIIGGGSYENTLLVNNLATHTGIPAVGFMVFDGLPIQACVFVSDKGLPNPVSNEAADAFFCKKDKVIERITLQNRLNWLEAIDIAMNFVKGLLLRGTEFEHSDLEKLIYQRQRNLVLRGTLEWPWWIYYINPDKKQEFLKNLFDATFYIPTIPDEVFERERVMVLGCGTGSLIVGELINYYKHLLLVDCKPFSVYNPVRQLIGTEWVNEELKPYVLQGYLGQFISPTGIESQHFLPEIAEDDLAKTIYTGEYSISAAELSLKEDSEDSKKKFQDLLDWFKPTLVVVAMGRTYDDNFVACEILRKRGIKHVVPSAFPGATHYKVVVVDGHNGPCYECFQNNLTLDVSPGIPLNEEMRSLLYSDPDDPTQPATIFETWPSAHLSLRLCLELSLSEQLRSAWFNSAMQNRKICFVGGNRSEKIPEGTGYIYGVEYPGQVVIYGVEDVAGFSDSFICDICGQKYEVRHKLET